MKLWSCYPTCQFGFDVIGYARFQNSPPTHIDASALLRVGCILQGLWCCCQVDWNSGGIDAHGNWDHIIAESVIGVGLDMLGLACFGPASSVCVHVGWHCV